MNINDDVKYCKKKLKDLKKKIKAIETKKDITDKDFEVLNHYYNVIYDVVDYLDRFGGEHFDLPNKHTK